LGATGLATAIPAAQQQQLSTKLHAAEAIPSHRTAFFDFLMTISDSGA
jgi:hypothetical protein